MKGAQRHASRRRPREVYPAWTPEQEERLRELHADEFTPDEIRRELDRCLDDVVRKIAELGLDTGCYEPDPALVPPVRRVCLKCEREFLSRTGNRICPDCHGSVEMQSPALSGGYSIARPGKRSVI